jgi:fructose-1,6-bisphosphatase/inositol monophosphatase family enzyme
MRFPNPEPHHSAIFVLMVQEAGGVVTDWTGDHEMLFSNHLLHDPLLSVLRNTPRRP